MKIFLKFFKILISYLIFPVLLIYIGYSQVWPLFTGEFTQHLGSIEVSYIQMAKFIGSSPHFLWQPNWYMGYPMNLLYTPLVPILEYIANILFQISYGHAYRILTAIGYIGGIISVYFLGKKICKNSLGGLIAGLIFGIAPSIISLMSPEVGSDTLLTNFIEPRRLTNLVRYGEGPHIVSLFFLPLAGLFFIKFLENRNKWVMLLAVIFSGLVALTNSVGAWALILLDFSLLFGFISENSHNWKSVITRAFVVTILTYGVISFWFNPLFLSNFFREGGNSLSFYSSLFPWGLIGIFIGVILFFLFAQKFLSKIKGLTSLLIFFFLTFIIVYEYYFSGVKLELVPQALRLSLELDMAVASLTGFIITTFIKLSVKIHRFLPLAAGALIIFLLSVYFIPKQMYLTENLSQLIRPLEATGENLQDTQMFAVAKNLQDLVQGNERVFVAGNYSFYLNYFIDIPQLRGALYQSATHPWVEHMYYQLVTGDDEQIALAWLKIANIGWLVVSGPGDIYADDFKYPNKFESILKFVKEDKGDKYYQVPLTDTSLAKTVSTKIFLLKKPFNAIDKQPIMDYLNILESSSGKLKFEQIVNGKYQISGQIKPQDLILVQQTYIDGWQATDQNGRVLELKKDPLGFILIKPQNTDVRINLEYRIPLSVKFGQILSAITLIIIIFLMFKMKKSKEQNNSVNVNFHDDVSDQDKL